MEWGDALLPAFVVVMAAAALFRAWLESRTRASEQVAWEGWAQTSKFTLSGTYPAYDIRGTIGGLEVALHHDVNYGAKGSAQYAVQASATLPDGFANLAVRRIGLVAQLFGARDVPTPTGSGELSVVASVEAGRLSESLAGSGSLSEPGSVVAPTIAASSRSLSSSEIEEDFAKRFEVSPSFAKIPAVVKRALLLNGNLRLGQGRIWFVRNGLMRSNEARRILTELAEMAVAFR